MESSFRPSDLYSAKDVPLGEKDLFVRKGSFTSRNSVSSEESRQSFVSSIRKLSSGPQYAPEKTYISAAEGDFKYRPVPQDEDRTNVPATIQGINVCHLLY